MTCLKAFAACLAASVAAAASPAAQSAVATAKEPKVAAVLHPASPWRIDYADNACRLVRTFGSDGRHNLTAFEQIAPGNVVTLTVAGPALDWVGEKGKFTIQARSDARPIELHPMNIELPLYGNGALVTGLAFDAPFFAKQHWGPLIGASSAPAISPADAGAVKRLVIRSSGREVAFETGDMTSPFRALNACTIDLLQWWGLSTEEHIGHSAVVLENERVELSKLQRKFAKGPGRKRHEAMLMLRVLVAADGTQTNCFHDFAAAQSEERFDACAEIKDLRFKPAKSAAGTPMPSYWAVTVPLNWVDPLAL